jgi:hypothetical protein
VNDAERKEKRKSGHGKRELGRRMVLPGGCDKA